MFIGLLNIYKRLLCLLGCTHSMVIHIQYIYIYFYSDNKIKILITFEIVDAQVGR